MALQVSIVGWWYGKHRFMLGEGVAQTSSALTHEYTVSAVGEAAGRLVSSIVPEQPSATNPSSQDMNRDEIQPAPVPSLST